MSDIVYSFGPFQLEPGAQRLLRQGQALPITARTLDTLRVLVENAGRTVDKDELLRRVWPDAIVEEANLTQQIFLLRKLLGESPRDHRYIATVPRRGYRFVAPVQAGATTPRAGAAVPLHLHLRLDAATSLEVEATCPFAVAPDGRSLAYVGRDANGTALYIRALDGGATRRVTGSDGASTPCFSPDGRWVAFFARGTLFKTFLGQDGSPIAVCAAPGDCRGVTWTTRDVIVFSPTPAAGLVAVSAHGGQPEEITRLDFGAGERTHRWPCALPNGREVLFTIARAGLASFDDAEIAIVSLESRTHRVVARFGSAPQALASGHLVHVRGGALWAASLDSALASLAPPVPVLTGVTTLPTGAGLFACSRTGLLVYLTGAAQDIGQRLCWVAGDGTIEPLVLPGGRYEEPRLSPDARHVAVGVRTGTSDIWVQDRQRGTSTRVSFEGDNFAPVWSPDGRAIVFSSNREGPCSLYRWTLNGNAPERLVTSEFDLVAGSWSPDGRTLLYTEYHPVTGADVHLWTGESNRPVPLLRTRANEFSPAFAPDGRAFAYVSDQSGRTEVYLRSLAADASPVPVTTRGGSEPVWQREGRRLYYRAGSAVVAVEVDLDALEVGAPVVVADGPFQAGGMTGIANFDVGPDGRLLVVSQTTARARPRELDVITDWFADLGDRSG